MKCFAIHATGAQRIPVALHLHQNPVNLLPAFLTFHKKTVFLSPWRNMLELSPVSSDSDTPVTLEPEGSSSHLSWYILL